MHILLFIAELFSGRSSQAINIIYCAQTLLSRIEDIPNANLPFHELDKITV